MKVVNWIIILSSATGFLPAQTYLSLAEEGEFRGKINVSGWEQGERFLRLSSHEVMSFPYLWQGEDSLDYRIEDGMMSINNEIVGADLCQIEREGIDIDEVCTRDSIKTLIVSGHHLHEIGCFPNLTAVYIKDMQPPLGGDVEEIDLSPLTQLAYLRGLFFCGAGVGISVDQLEVISNCSELRDLDFDVCILPSNPMAQVKKLPNLRKLTIASVPDGQMASLSGHPRLESISRYWMPFDSLWLEILPALPSLVELSAVQCEIADTVLEYLAETNQLEGFFCPAAGIYGDKISIISQMTNLRELDLTGTEIQSKDAYLLENLANLEHLDLTGIDLDAEEITGISKLPKLRVLSISLSNTDALQHLKSLQHLEELDLTYSDITSEGLRTLASMKTLTYLNLTGTEISDEDIKILRQSLPGCTIVKN